VRNFDSYYGLFSFYCVYPYGMGWFSVGRRNFCFSGEFEVLVRNYGLFVVSLRLGRSPCGKRKECGLHDFWSLRLFETAGSHVVCSIFEGEERGR
jgi:hypothetical protein